MIKFKALIERTINNRFNWAIEKASEKYDKDEPNSHSDLWNHWYHERDNYIDKMLEEWYKTHDKSEEFTTLKEIITDFSINGNGYIIKQPSIKILKIAKFTGEYDCQRNETYPNGQEIYEFDIVSEIYGREGTIVWDDYNLGYKIKLENGELVNVRDFESILVIGSELDEM